MILPDSFIALDHMLRRFTRIVRGMVVYPERMRENLDRSRGVVFSGTVLLELARKGVSREQAYEWVQRNAMRSFDEQRDFKTLLLADPDVSRRAVASGNRARVRPRRAAEARRTHIFDRVFRRPAAGPTERGSLKVSSMRARVFVTLEAIGVRPAGQDDRRRAALARLRRRRRRAAGQVLRARSGDDRGGAGRRRWPPKSPTSCWPTR